MVLSKKKKWLIYLFCIFVAFSFLLIASNNSFLYKFNDWIDVNWYITMGRGLLDGKVMYRDLYEQKGPLTYFVFAVLGLFDNVYYAVFILEVICLSIFLILAYKLLSKHLDISLSLIGVVLIALLLTCCPFFVVGGGSVEEYMMPIFMYFLLVLVAMIESEYKFTRIKSILAGVMLAIVFWVKYTMIVLPGCILLLWLIFEIRNKRFKAAIVSILFMLIGFLIVTLPIIMYFVGHGAFKDLMISYFYNNLFKYKSQPDMMGNILNFVVLGICPFVFNILGVAHTFRLYGKRAWMYAGVMIAYLLSLLIFDCCVYYFLPTIVFNLMGIIMMLSSFKYVGFKIVGKCMMVTLSFIVMFSSSFLFANGIFEMGRDRSEYAQFQIAEDIRSFNLEDPTIFCYRMYDYGVYTVCGVVPEEKYFARNNFTRDEFPEMYDGFENAIRTQLHDFVVVQKNVYNEDKELLETYYDCYKEYSYHYIESTFSTHKEEFILMVKSV